MIVKSLVYFIVSLFTVSALGALPPADSDESAESTPPIFVEQEDGSLILEHGTIAIEQEDGSLILAHGIGFPNIRDSSTPPYKRPDKKIAEATREKRTLRERVIRILLPFKK